VIRFHAIGDVALVLPLALRYDGVYPDARIDLLTSPRLPPRESDSLFDSVFTVDQRQTVQDMEHAVLRRAPARLEQYHVVLDLQRTGRPDGFVGWLTRDRGRI